MIWYNNFKKRLFPQFGEEDKDARGEATAVSTLDEARIKQQICQV
jgi:hypothetical protein